MTLGVHRVIQQTAEGPEPQLVVGCPQQLDPVPLLRCAECELCGGIDTDPRTGRIALHCGAQGLVREDSDGPVSACDPIAATMTSPVVTVGADTAIENVRWLLVERGIGAVPVVDGRGRVVGMLTKTDLLRDAEPGLGELDASPRAVGRGEPGTSPRELEGALARDRMTPVVHTLPESAPIRAAAALMAREKVHHVVVIDAAGHPIGIVSSMDLVRWLAGRERFR